MVATWIVWLGTHYIRFASATWIASGGQAQMGSTSGSARDPRGDVVRNSVSAMRWRGVRQNCGSTIGIRAATCLYHRNNAVGAGVVLIICRVRGGCLTDGATALAAGLSADELRRSGFRGDFLERVSGQAGSLTVCGPHIDFGAQVRCGSSPMVPLSPVKVLD